MLTNPRTKWTAPVAVVVILLLTPTFLFGAYMGAYYLAMPSDCAEQLSWRLGIVNQIYDGPPAFFGPALLIERRLYEPCCSDVDE